MKTAKVSCGWILTAEYMKSTAEKIRIFGRHTDEGSEDTWKKEQ